MSAAEGPTLTDPTASERASALVSRLAQPWRWLIATSLLAALAARWYGERTVGRGENLDLMIEGAVIGVVSVGVVWAPMLAMRVARRAWPRLPLSLRVEAARNIATHGLLLGPALALLVASTSEVLPGFRLLGTSLVGCVLVSLGGAASLWLRRGA